MGHTSQHPDKVEKVKEWPRATTVQEVRAFLGLANYFKKFMQGYSQMVFAANRLDADQEGLELDQQMHRSI